MIVRLANALHWIFSGVAVFLLLSALLASWGNSHPADFIPVVFVFLGIALLSWLVGRGFHYVLGGDASALWEEALVARARRSPGFRKGGISIVLLAVVSVAWSILDAQHQEALREQQYEQQRQEAARQEAARQAAIAAQQAAIQAEADRKAAALRDGVIDPSDLSMTAMIGTAWGGEAAGTWKPMSMDLSGTVVNHSNKTLRAIEIKVQVRDCPQCLVTNEWDRQYSVDVPPGQQRSFGGQAWRIKSDGKSYTWQLLTASACSWDYRGSKYNLVCP
jgi:hypothetical protein